MCIAAWGADYGITKTSAINSSSAGQLLCSTGRFCGDAISRVHLEKSAVCLFYFDSCLDCTGLCSGRASKLEQAAFNSGGHCENSCAFSGCCFGKSTGKLFSALKTKGKAPEQKMILS